MGDSNLNPFVALIAEKRVQLQRTLDKLHMLEARVPVWRAWTNSGQVPTQVQAADAYTNIPWSTRPAWDGSTDTLSLLRFRGEVAMWISHEWAGVNASLNAEVSALQREIADLSEKRDELDRRAAAAVAGGASLEAAYNGERSKMQFWSTAATVGVYALVIAAALGVIWLGIKLFKRINRSK